jgi:small subunit ribosomal protein S1
MAKKQEAEKELKAKQAELETVAATGEKETIESEADSISIEEIKSQIATAPREDFDWDADDKKFGNYTDSEREKMEKLYDGTFSSITKGEIITGTVVNVNNKDVVLNVGFKSDGLVSVSEFRDTPDLKIGDTVDVFVESQEDANGQLVLSRKRAKTQKSWERINSALDNDEIITGFVKSRTKGGLIVDIMGVEAFLPGSQIDIKPIRDYDVYVGKTMEFKVVKINHEFKNVVVSHKVLI